MRLALRIGVSLLFGLALLIPLATFYEFTRLPVYHGWGLMHGSFTTALPALVGVSFVVIGLIPWFGPTTDSIERIVAAMSVFPLVTILFWVDQSSSYAAFSLAHLAVYIAVFVSLTILCVRSNKPFLIPLFLLIPVLIDPVFALVLTIGYSPETALDIFTSDFLSKIVPVAVASVSAIALARYIHVRKA